MTEQLLRVREVADLLDLSMRTVLERFERGELPGFRLFGRKGGPVRFRASEIDRWLDDTCRVPTHNVSDHKNGPAAQTRPGPGSEGSTSDAQTILRPV